MSKYKVIFLGLGCFGLGAAAGYIYASRTLRDMYLQDIRETKQFYNDKLEELGVMPANAEYEVLPDDYEEASDEEVKEAFERVTGMRWDTGEPLEVPVTDEEYERMIGGGSRRVVTNYNKPDLRVLAQDKGINDPYHGDEYEDEEDYLDEEEELELLSDEFARDQEEHRKNERPYVIAFDEFQEGPEDYERVELFYYAEDRVLCDDMDIKVEVDDEEELVGFDYEDVLDVQTTAWVKNDVIRALYEINMVNGSYERDVKNAIETPAERENRMRNRRKRR